MHLDVLMTIALWPIGVKLQLPFVGRFCEGRLKAPPLRRDLRTITKSSRKERTQLQTVELGWRAARTGLRTIVAATPGGSAARKSILHALAKGVHARHPCIDGVLYRRLLVGGKSAIEREPCRASLLPLRDVLLLQLIGQ